MTYATTEISDRSQGTTFENSNDCIIVVISVFHDFLFFFELIDESILEFQVAGSFSSFGFASFIRSALSWPIFYSIAIPLLARHGS